MKKENLEFPLVSVAMRAYKVEPFIEQAIKGVLMQDYKGEIELIISDDNSPDKTGKIIKEIMANHPHGSWIKYTHHKKNKGMVANLLWTIQQANGEYIAPCDSDDCWTDPLKIQKQVDFMRKNSDCSLSGHAFRVSYGDDRPDHIKKRVETPSLCTLKDFLEGRGFRAWTTTMLFKASLVPFFEEWLEQATNIDDFAIYMISGHYGKFGYLPDVMSVYNRESTPDAWSSKNKNIKEVLKYIEDKDDFFNYFNSLTDGVYADSIEKNKQRSLKRYAHNINKQGYSRRDQLKLICAYWKDFLKPEKENLIIFRNFLLK